MQSIRIDRIEGSSLRMTAEGIEAERIAIVSGITGRASNRLRQAVEDAQMPKVGEAHPSIPQLFVHSLSAKPDGPSGAIVTVLYRSRESPSAGHGYVEFGTSLTHTVTDTDRNGQRITVSYSPSGDDADLQTQVGRVAMQAPQTTIGVTRFEEISPLVQAKQFVGRVNRSAVFDGEPRQWLCTAVTGRSLDGGKTYETNYEFQFNARGWQPRVTFIDPQTNRPPPDLVEGKGAVTANVYQNAEFRDLGF